MPNSELIGSLMERLNFCFVCDQPISGNHFLLSKCTTETSQRKMSSKLEELVGPTFLIQISKSDLLCRNCWCIINKMDTLEDQLSNLGYTLLKNLEKKYSFEFEPGEIFETVPPLNISFKKKDKNDIIHVNENEMETKERENVPTKNNSDQRVFECPRCVFKTNFNAFLIYHLRQHTKQDADMEILYEKDNDHVSKALDNNVESKRSNNKKTAEVQSMKMVGNEKRDIGVMLHVKPSLVSKLILNEDLVEKDMDNELFLQPLETQSPLNNSSSFKQTETLSTLVDSHPEESPNDDIVVTKGEETDNVVPLDCQEVLSNPKVVMVDTSTGKILQRLRKAEDDSIISVEYVDSTLSRQMVQQLDDGNFALVSLPELEDGTNDQNLVDFV